MLLFSYWGGVSSNLAYASNYSEGNTLYVEDEQVGLGGTVKRYKPDDGRDLNSFENIIVTINNASGGNAHALYGGTLQDGNGFGDFSNTSFNVNISGDAMNADALHIKDWENHVVIKDFTANVSTKNSDAINIGHEGTGNRTVNFRLAGEIPVRRHHSETFTGIGKDGRHADTGPAGVFEPA